MHKSVFIPWFNEGHQIQKDMEFIDKFNYLLQPTSRDNGGSKCALEHWIS